MAKWINKKQTVNIPIMICIDLFVKSIIWNCFMDHELLIGNRLGFRPYLNKDQLSIFNNEFNMNVSLSFLMIVNVIGIAAIMIYRRYLQTQKEWNRYTDFGILMILSGAISSLIDKILWGGSLDYLLLFTQICDLKDLYMFAGLFIFAADIIRQHLCASAHHKAGTE